jgi:hypothetical protein
MNSWPSLTDSGSLATACGCCCAPLTHPGPAVCPRSWHSLRFLHGGGSGGTAGAGCVKPALLSLANNSLVLSGGRPSPLSRDVVGLAHPLMHS